MDYFLGDMEGGDGEEHITPPSNFYASVEDPLLQELKFCVGSQNAQSPRAFTF